MGPLSPNVHSSSIHSDKDRISPEDFKTKLSSLSQKPGFFSGNLIVKEGGNLSSTNVFQVLWQKIKKIFGGYDGSNRYLVEYKTLQFLLAGRRVVKTEEDIELVRLVAEKAGLTPSRLKAQSEHKNSEEVEELIEEIRRMLFDNEGIDQSNTPEEAEALLFKFSAHYREELSPFSLESKITQIFNSAIVNKPEDPFDAEEDSSKSDQEKPCEDSLNENPDNLLNSFQQDPQESEKEPNSTPSASGSLDSKERLGKKTEELIDNLHEKNIQPLKEQGLSSSLGKMAKTAGIVGVAVIAAIGIGCALRNYMGGQQELGNANFSWLTQCSANDQLMIGSQPHNFFSTDQVIPIIGEAAHQIVNKVLDVGESALHQVEDLAQSVGDTPLAAGSTFLNNAQIIGAIALPYILGVGGSWIVNKYRLKKADHAKTKVTPAKADPAKTKVTTNNDRVEIQSKPLGNDTCGEFFEALTLDLNDHQSLPEVWQRLEERVRGEKELGILLTIKDEEKEFEIKISSDEAQHYQSMINCKPYDNSAVSSAVIKLSVVLDYINSRRSQNSFDFSNYSTVFKIFKSHMNRYLSDRALNIENQEYKEKFLKIRDTIKNYFESLDGKNLPLRQELALLELASSEKGTFFLEQLDEAAKIDEIPEIERLYAEVQETVLVPFSFYDDFSTEQIKKDFQNLSIRVFKGIGIDNEVLLNLLKNLNETGLYGKIIEEFEKFSNGQPYDSQAVGFAILKLEQLKDLNDDDNSLGQAFDYYASLYYQANKVNFADKDGMEVFFGKLEPGALSYQILCLISLEIDNSFSAKIENLQFTQDMYDNELLPKLEEELKKYDFDTTFKDFVKKELANAINSVIRSYVRASVKFDNYPKPLRYLSQKELISNTQAILTYLKKCKGKMLSDIRVFINETKNPEEYINFEEYENFVKRHVLKQELEVAETAENDFHILKSIIQLHYFFFEYSAKTSHIRERYFKNSSTSSIEKVLKVHKQLYFEERLKKLEHADAKIDILNGFQRLAGEPFTIDEKIAFLEFMVKVESQDIELDYKTMIEQGDIEVLNNYSPLRQFEELMLSGPFPYNHKMIGYSNKNFLTLLGKIEAGLIPSQELQNKEPIRKVVEVLLEGDVPDDLDGEPLEVLNFDFNDEEAMNTALEQLHQYLRPRTSLDQKEEGLLLKISSEKEQFEIKISSQEVHNFKERIDSEFYDPRLACFTLIKFSAACDHLKDSDHLKDAKKFDQCLNLIKVWARGYLKKRDDESNDETLKQKISILGEFAKHFDHSHSSKRMQLAIWELALSENGLVLLDRFEQAAGDLEIEKIRELFEEVKSQVVEPFSFEDELSTKQIKKDFDEYTLILLEKFEEQRTVERKKYLASFDVLTFDPNNEEAACSALQEFGDLLIGKKERAVLLKIPSGEEEIEIRISQDEVKELKLMTSKLKYNHSLACSALIKLSVACDHLIERLPVDLSAREMFGPEGAFNLLLQNRSSKNKLSLQRLMEACLTQVDESIHFCAKKRVDAISDEALKEKVSSIKDIWMEDDEDGAYTYNRPSLALLELALSEKGLFLLEQLQEAWTDLQVEKIQERYDQIQEQVIEPFSFDDNEFVTEQIKKDFQKIFNLLLQHFQTDERIKEVLAGILLLLNQLNLSKQEGHSDSMIGNFEKFINKEIYDPQAVGTAILKFKDLFDSKWDEVEAASDYCASRYVRQEIEKLEKREKELFIKELKDIPLMSQVVCLAFMSEAGEAFSKWLANPQLRNHIYAEEIAPRIQLTLNNFDESTQKIIEENLNFYESFTVKKDPKDQVLCLEFKALSASDLIQGSAAISNLLENQSDKAIQNWRKNDPHVNFQFDAYKAFAQHLRSEKLENIPLENPSRVLEGIALLNDYLIHLHNYPPQVSSEQELDDINWAFKTLECHKHHYFQCRIDALDDAEAVKILIKDLENLVGDSLSLDEKIACLEFMIAKEPNYEVMTSEEPKGKEAYSEESNSENEASLWSDYKTLIQNDGLNGLKVMHCDVFQSKNPFMVNESIDNQVNCNFTEFTRKVEEAIEQKIKKEIEAFGRLVNGERLLDEYIALLEAVSDGSISRERFEFETEFQYYSLFCCGKASNNAVSTVYSTIQNLLKIYSYLIEKLKKATLKDSGQELMQLQEALKTLEQRKIDYFEADKLNKKDTYSNPLRFKVFEKLETVFSQHEGFSIDMKIFLFQYLIRFQNNSPFIEYLKALQLLNQANPEEKDLIDNLWNDLEAKGSAIYGDVDRLSNVFNGCEFHDTFIDFDEWLSNLIKNKELDLSELFLELEKPVPTMNQRLASGQEILDELIKKTQSKYMDMYNIDEAGQEGFEDYKKLVNGDKTYNKDQLLFNFSELDEKLNQKAIQKELSPDELKNAALALDALKERYFEDRTSELKGSPLLDEFSEIQSFVSEGHSLPVDQRITLLMAISSSQDFFSSYMEAAKELKAAGVEPLQQSRQALQTNPLSKIYNEKIKFEIRRVRGGSLVDIVGPYFDKHIADFHHSMLLHLGIKDEFIAPNDHEWMALLSPEEFEERKEIGKIVLQNRLEKRKISYRYTSDISFEDYKKGVEKGTIKPIVQHSPTNITGILYPDLIDFTSDFSENEFIDIYYSDYSALNSEHFLNCKEKVHSALSRIEDSLFNMRMQELERLDRESLTSSDELKKIENALIALEDDKNIYFEKVLPDLVTDENKSLIDEIQELVGENVVFPINYKVALLELSENGNLDSFKEILAILKQGNPGAAADYLNKELKTFPNSLNLFNTVSRLHIERDFHSFCCWLLTSIVPLQDRIDLGFVAEKGLISPLLATEKKNFGFRDFESYGVRGKNDWEKVNDACDFTWKGTISVKQEDGKEVPFFRECAFNFSLLSAEEENSLGIAEEENSLGITEEQLPDIFKFVKWYHNASFSDKENVEEFSNLSRNSLGLTYVQDLFFNQNEEFWNRDEKSLQKEDLEKYQRARRMKMERVILPKYQVLLQMCKNFSTAINDLMSEAGLNEIQKSEIPLIVPKETQDLESHSKLAAPSVQERFLDAFDDSGITCMGPQEDSDQNLDLEIVGLTFDQRLASGQEVLDELIKKTTPEHMDLYNIGETRKGAFYDYEIFVKGDKTYNKYQLLFNFSDLDKKLLESSDDLKKFKNAALALNHLKERYFEDRCNELKDSTLLNKVLEIQSFVSEGQPLPIDQRITLLMAISSSEDFFSSYMEQAKELKTSGVEVFKQSIEALQNNPLSTIYQQLFLTLIESVVKNSVGSGLMVSHYLKKHFKDFHDSMLLRVGFNDAFVDPDYKEWMAVLSWEELGERRKNGELLLKDWLEKEKISYLYCDDISFKDYKEGVETGKIKPMIYDIGNSALTYPYLINEPSDPLLMMNELYTISFKDYQALEREGFISNRGWNHFANSQMEDCLFNLRMKELQGSLEPSAPSLKEIEDALIALEYRKESYFEKVSEALTTDENTQLIKEIEQLVGQSIPLNCKVALLEAMKAGGGNSLSLVLKALKTEPLLPKLDFVKSHLNVLRKGIFKDSPFKSLSKIHLERDFHSFCCWLLAPIVPLQNRITLGFVPEKGTPLLEREKRNFGFKDFKSYGIHGKNKWERAANGKCDFTWQGTIRVKQEDGKDAEFFRGCAFNFSKLTIEESRLGITEEQLPDIFKFVKWYRNASSSDKKNVEEFDNAPQYIQDLFFDQNRGFWNKDKKGYEEVYARQSFQKKNDIRSKYNSLLQMCQDFSTAVNDLMSQAGLNEIQNSEISLIVPEKRPRLERNSTLAATVVQEWGGDDHDIILIENILQSSARKIFCEYFNQLNALAKSSVLNSSEEITKLPKYPESQKLKSDIIDCFNGDLPFKNEDFEQEFSGFHEKLFDLMREKAKSNTPMKDLLLSSLAFPEHIDEGIRGIYQSLHEIATFAFLRKRLGADQLPISDEEANFTHIASQTSPDEVAERVQTFDAVFNSCRVLKALCKALSRDEKKLTIVKKTLFAPHSLVLDIFGEVTAEIEKITDDYKKLKSLSESEKKLQEELEATVEAIDESEAVVYSRQNLQLDELFEERNEY